VKKKKLLIYGPEISGFNDGLRQAVTRTGHACRVVSIGPNKFLYGGVGSPELDVSSNSKDVFFAKARSLLRRIEALWLSVFWADAVLYVSGSTPTGTFLEPKILRLLLNKRLNFLFHGSDARPPYLNGARHKEGMPVDWRKIKGQVHEIKRLVEKVEAAGARVFAYPGISHFFSKEFLDWQLLGMPVADSATMKSGPVRKRKEPDLTTRILHSPSNPSAKGTEAIRAMVLQLQQEGFNIDYLELQDVPNTAVREAISRADIAIDQLYCDRPGAAFSLECVSAGVLCLVGSPHAAWLKNHYRDSIIQPCYLVDSAELLHVLRQYLDSPEEKNKLSSQLHSASNTNFSPEKIGEKWVAAIFFEPAPDVYFNPFDLDSEMGGFASKTHLAELVRGIVREYGVDALGLGHNPLLQERVLRMSQ
jgi:hypothetical protein